MLPQVALLDWPVHVSVHDINSYPAVSYFDGTSRTLKCVVLAVCRSVQRGLLLSLL